MDQTRSHSSHDEGDKDLGGHARPNIPTRHSIERLPVADLTPWEGNPRRMTDSARAGLEASITRFGCVQPIVFNQRTGRVVGGHQRLEVLRARGVKETDVVIVDLPEVEERALNVALNNPHIAGDWTPEVRGLLDELSGAFDGFSDLRLDTLLEELGRTNLRDTIEGGAVDEDEAIEPPEEPTTRPGDLWVLGPHRLICGDSTDPDILSRLLDGALADGVFTDPPFGVNYDPTKRCALKGRNGRAVRRKAGQNDQTSPRTRSRKGRSGADRTIANDALGATVFRDLLDRSFRSIDAVITAGAPVYICGPSGWEAHHFWAAWPEERWHFQVAITWDKGRFALSRWDYHPRHEAIFYGWKKGKHPWLGGRKESSVWEVEMGSGKGYVHPTQKPVGLVRRALLNSIPEGRLVLDPFGGSGSTLIAAETCGRRSFLCELDPAFVDAAVARWERYTGQTASREETLR